MNPGHSSDRAPKQFRRSPSVGCVVKNYLREISKIAGDPDNSRDAQGCVLKALQTSLVPNPNVVESASDGELRRAIGLAIGSSELEHHDYTLEHASNFVARHGQFIDAILTNRELAEYLAPALLAPMLFDKFECGRDGLSLRATANRLRTSISKPALEVWESLVARSIIWAYEDPIVSPCPVTYQNALGVQDSIVRSIESYEDEHQLLELVGELSAEGFSIPTSLWKVCAGEVREDIARAVPVESVLYSVKNLLRSTRDESRHLLLELHSIAKSRRYTDAGDVNDAEAQVDSRFSHLIEDVSERLSFFKEFIQLKEQGILLDPIHERFEPRLRTQKVDYQQNPVSYYEARFTEFLQKALGRDLIVTVGSISQFFAADQSFVPVTKEFVSAVTELSEQCGIFLDDEIATEKRQKPFYEKHLLPAFFKYIRRGDLESAHHIRLLFPESSCECIQCNRYPIDDAIAEHQGVLAEGVYRAAKRIALKAPRWLHAQDGAKQDLIENDINTYRNALALFVHTYKQAPIEARFVDGMVEVVISLIKADIVRNQQLKNSLDLQMQTDDGVPVIYRGAQSIASLLRVFEYRPDVQKECMERVYQASTVDVSQYLSDLIESTNEQLIRSLEIVKDIGTSLLSIERECENVFAAETVYLSMSKEARDDLPMPISRYLRIETRLGIGVLQTQHDLHPEKGVGISQPLNARRLQLWSQGLIGEHTSPLRREFLDQFFRQLRMERRIVPKELQPLVFDALEQYAKGFMENINQLSSDVEFRDGLVVILGGFLLSSHEMQGPRRMELARVLSRVFTHARSQEFCPHSVSHNDVARAFQDLLLNMLHDYEQGAMNTFMSTKSISGVLSHLGLLDRSDRVDPTV